MAALPTVASVVRISFTWTDVVRSFGSRFFYGYTGSAPTETACAALASTIAASYTTNFAPLANTGLALTQIVVQDLSTNEPGVGIWTGNIAGTRPGPGLPSSSPVDIDFKIPYLYRGGKPRIYLPFGVADDQLTATSWSTAFIAAVDAAWSAFTQSLDGVAFGANTLTQHVSVAYYKGYNKNTPPWRGPGFKYPPMIQDPPPVYPVTSHVVRAQYGAQRRRTNP